MKKISATYRAPSGDSKVTEAFGHTFFDGKPEDIEIDDVLAVSLLGNQHFECVEQKNADPKIERKALDK